MKRALDALLHGRSCPGSCAVHGRACDDHAELAPGVTHAFIATCRRSTVELPFAASLLVVAPRGSGCRGNAPGNPSVAVVCRATTRRVLHSEVTLASLHQAPVTENPWTKGWRVSSRWLGS
jgi:hypothetical protein